jgi:single-strand DNA-binding protein
MAGSINKVILLGRLGADPEVRVSQEGNKIARFSIATSESWKDKNTNEKKDKTEWHKIVIFSPGLADVVEKYLKKGSLIYVEGQIRYRKYTDQSGIEKNISEIVLQGFNSNLTMVDNKNQNEINDSSTPSFENSNVDKNLGQEFNDSDIEDEVPF